MLTLIGGQSALPATSQRAAHEYAWDAPRWTIGGPTVDIPDAKNEHPQAYTYLDEHLSLMTVDTRRGI